jgi:FKBP-type peptidyl-prolyl cis-trans isomerase 2
MDQVRLNCPQCNVVLRITNPALFGKQGKCPRCAAIFTIPKPGDEEPITITPVEPDAPAARTVAAGDRVLARWHDGFFYPGVVKAIDPDEVTVRYDDGQAMCLPPASVRPLELAEGDRVFARWQGGPSYFPGRVQKFQGDRVHVHYDDGEREIVAVGLIRILRRQDVPWYPGDRVLANWMPEPFFYPATVTDVTDDGIITVDYLDGDQAMLVPGQVLPFEVNEGDHVFVRREDGKLYFPAVIETVDGDRIVVRYEEDDFREDTGVERVRVLPQRAS